MSTKRDLVEAHSYNRRRLITAFVSGAPGGREVEPVRHGRTLIGGVVLAVFVVVGAAVSGFIAQPVPDDWAQRGIIVGKDSGTRYFANDNTLYPVLNYTSALLLLGGQDDGDATTVSESDIASKPKGSTLGISGAPEALPSTGDLVQSGWVACTGSSGGVHVTISPRPAVSSAGDAALLVASGDEEYAVIGERRYAVPSGSARTSILRAVGLDGQSVVDVPGTWLDLFPSGSPLEVPQVPGAGRPAKGRAASLGPVGTPVLVDGEPRVVGRNGQLITLTPFAYRLYSSTGLTQKKVSISDVAGVRTDTGTGIYETDWPTDVPRSYSTPQTPCVRLDAAPGEAPSVELAVAKDDSATRTSGDSVVRTVSNGRGALVRAVSGGVLDAGTVYLVDGTGTAYAVGTAGSEKDTQASLRLGRAEPVPVPRSWIDVLGAGPQLSAQAAARSASATQGQGS